MKKILYAIMFVAAAGTSAQAQTPTTAPAAAPATEVNNDPNAAEITFETEVHDFGTIEYGGNGAYDFKFTNTGKSPLIISNARGSCGCTVPKWPKEPIAKGSQDLSTFSMIPSALVLLLKQLLLILTQNLLQK